MNVSEMMKYDKSIACKLNKICRVLHEDKYYPKNKIYETAIAILTEVMNNGWSS